MTQPFTYSILFILGTAIGSFLNVVADRLENGESILFGRSHCDKCKAKLAAKDLFPILSFMSLKGKCRYCQTKFSSSYLLAEVLTGSAFVFAAVHSGVVQNPTTTTLLSFGFLTVVLCAYIAIVISDIKYQIIPDKVLIPTVVFVLVYITAIYVLSYMHTYTQLKSDVLGPYLIKVGYLSTIFGNLLKSYLSVLLSSAGISVFFIFLILLTKGRGMGFGDVKLGFLIGLVNGWPTNVLAIFLGFLFGAAFSLGLIALGKKSMKDTIAFGPFLILGSVVSLVWGHSLLGWYLGVF